MRAKYGRWLVTVIWGKTARLWDQKAEKRSAATVYWMTAKYFCRRCRWSFFPQLAELALRVEATNGSTVMAWLQTDAGLQVECVD